MKNHNWVSEEKIDEIQMGMNLVKGDEYRETLAGISASVSDVLVKTLGPYAATTTIDDGTFTYPTKDGWSVLNRLRFADVIHETLFKFIKQISFALNSKVGDGTTTTLVLLEGIFNEGLKLITVGRLAEEKGYYRLISILAKLKKEGYDFSLVIIGDGPERDKLLKHCDELNMNDKVVFLLEQKNPFKYVSKSDAFICSSFEEGYSTACTESCILNIPVVTTSVGGAEEIINDAECGLLCDLSDEGLYGALKSVLDNPQMIDEWKETLKDTKKNFFASERVKRLFNIFNV